MGSGHETIIILVPQVILMSRWYRRHKNKPDQTVIQVAGSQDRELTGYYPLLQRIVAMWWMVAVALQFSISCKRTASYHSVAVNIVCHYLSTRRPADIT